MDFISTFQIVNSSKIFKNFIKENPDAELVAGFFIMDLTDNNSQRSLDYKLNEKIFTFSLNQDDEITMKEDELIQSNNPLTKISPDIKLDLEEIKEIAIQETLKNNVKDKFEKIIAVLQMYDNREIWNLTCMLEGFVILNILIDSETGEIIKFDKKSITDFVQRK